MELRIIAQGRDLLCGNILDKQNFAGLVCAVGCVSVLDQVPLDTVKLDCVRIPVVGVLGHHNVRAGYPLGNIEGSVGDISLCGSCPSVPICLNSRLLYRAQGCECRKAAKE